MDNPLVGVWEKTTVSACSEKYPDTLDFQPNGIYVGHREPQGTFTIWDAGAYSIVADDRVRISTANDALVTYSFAIAGHTVTFTDSASCAFTYRRTGA